MRVALPGRPANFLRCCCRLGLVSIESFRLLSAEPHLHPPTAGAKRLPRAFDHVAGMESPSWADSGSRNRSAAGARLVACMLPTPNWSLHLWMHVLHAGFRGLLPVHAVLLETVGDGQRCGKADPARTTSPAVPTRRYTMPMSQNLLLPAGSMWNLQETSTRHLYETLRPPRARCAMREARSSSSPKAAAISFTYSRYGYVH